MRVSDGTRVVGEFENESKANILSMAISNGFVGRTNKPASRISFYALKPWNGFFCSQGGVVAGDS